MAKFRKKPVVIEAEQFFFIDRDFEAVKQDAARLGISIFDRNSNCVSENPEHFLYAIPTLEGVHEVGNGDWIITGVKGEKYPCKPDIFDLTYENVI